MFSNRKKDRFDSSSKKTKKMSAFVLGLGFGACIAAFGVWQPLTLMGALQAEEIFAENIPQKSDGVNAETTEQPAAENVQNKNDKPQTDKIPADKISDDKVQDDKNFVGDKKIEQKEVKDDKGVVWRSLFDGKTLNGWESVDYGGEGEVSVKNGHLNLAMGATMTGIRYQGKFPKKDFELSYEAQRIMGTDFFAAATFPVGESFCSLINGGWGGSVFGLSCVDGYDASENSTASYVGFKNKKWYKFRVRVTEKMIQAWLDDESKVEFVIGNHKIALRMEVEDFTPLGFGAWVSEGEIRNVKYRMLTEKEVKEMNDKADKEQPQIIYFTP